jgi:predicted aminopeptidase
MSRVANPRFKLALIIVIVATMLSAGCETIHFYRQAAWGQFKLMHARIPVAQAVQDAEVSTQAVAGLHSARRILNFAENELKLAADGRYQSYVQLDRDYVLWNLFAAEAYSVAGVQWCYPLVGCAPYRGYFSESAVEALAQNYQQRGFETYVGGVPAYSTLGWFDDPLLSSFIVWPAPDLANLLIHELAHSRIWVNGDVAFNESFAEFVGNAGAAAWLAREGQDAQWQQWVQQTSAGLRFRDFLEQARDYLQDVYQSPVETLAANKATAVRDIQACYAAQKPLLGEGKYDQLMAQQFNNALLVSISTYADWLPAFAQLHDRAAGDWQQFFSMAEELAELEFDARQARLQTLAEQQESQRRDDKHPDEINCKAFFGHGTHREADG